LTNGATQGNHARCLALAPEGAEVVIQRNAHTSVFDGLVLSGGMPNFVMPEYDAELGLSHCVTPTSLDAALFGSKPMRAVMITSPTYYGMTADVAALARVTHVADVALIVDRAAGTSARGADLPGARNRLSRRRSSIGTGQNASHARPSQGSAS
jgi:arginine decarboxylase